MLVYISMTVLTCLFAAYAEKLYRKSTNKTVLTCTPTPGISLWALLAIAAIVPSVLVSGLRFEVGTDYLVYLRDNHIIGSVFAGKSYDTEPLYRLIVQIGYLFNSKQLIFFLTSLLFSVFIFCFIYSQSQDWVLSVVLLMLTGVFNTSMNLMRQMVAVAICMYASKYALKKDFTRYLIFVVIASLIHSMSIVFLPLYFLVNWKAATKRRIILCVLIISLLGSAFYTLIGQILTSAGNVYAKYFGSSRDTGASTAVTLVFYCIFFLSFFLTREDTQESRLYLLYQGLGCIMLAMELPNANRLAYMFAPIQIVAVPNLLRQVKDPGWRLVLKTGVIMIYSVFFLYYIYHLNIGGTFPYQSIFG